MVLPFSQYICVSIYIIGHEQGILNKKVLFFIQMANSLRKKSILKCKISVTTIYHIPVNFIPSHHLNRDLLNNLFTLIDCKQMDISIFLIANQISMQPLILFPKCTILGQNFVFASGKTTHSVGKVINCSLTCLYWL